VVGLLSWRYNWPPVSTYRRLTSAQPLGYDADVTGRQALPCPKADSSTAVILALGQSNAANWSARDATPARPSPEVTNFFDGVCYLADDRSLGANGEGVSIWRLVGDALVARHAFTHVVIASFAIGATSIEDWTTRPYFQRRLDHIVADLNAHNLPPTAVAWFQGEADGLGRTPAAKYVASFNVLERQLRDRGVRAPIYVSTTTLCQGAPNAGVRSAQREIQALNGVRAGPDTDALGLAYRWDGCHFTAEGRALVARLWADALTAH
jgi:lysophospholipase L1-like esterase